MDLQCIGRRCKTARAREGYKQADVARDTGYGVENISSFENGRNDNARLLLWYLTHVLSVNDLMGGYNGT